ncbi:MAG: AAA family ATPase [Hyphomicrobiaceae bacterium]
MTARPKHVSHMHWPRDVEATAEFESAAAYVEDGEGHLFVTGKAGTGKSTLLKALRDEDSHEMVVLAPTGLAAVQVGGQTIHSFFGLPPRLIKAEDIRPSRRLGLMRKLKTLVIDEVSMVRSDLMDGIDKMLRLNRKRPNDPFGGVRLVMFGDLHQLPPVITEPELGLYLTERFGGPFFFDAPAFREATAKRVELGRVFRQRDARFLTALNHIREGSPGLEDLAMLNERVAPLDSLPRRDDYVILTPTNQVAQEINMAFLKALPGRTVMHEALVSGTYAETAQPTDAVLTLKEGAKVILIRNDPERRWVNGTLARVSRLDDDRVFVEIEGEEHEVEPEVWEAIRYDYDAKEDRIVETLAGSFRQLPLRLAWALTIHKAQGMTLDRVFIDLRRGTFAHGQAYVALSRVRTLGGLAMARPLRRSDIIFDRAVTGYRDVFEALEPASA